MLKKATPESTKIKTQNNHIHNNGTVLIQETIQNIKTEQLISRKIELKTRAEILPFITVVVAVKTFLNNIELRGATIVIEILKG